MTISKSDGWKIFTAIFVVLIPGLIALWISNLPGDPIIHIKIIYSILYALAVLIFIYFIISRTEDKKNVKRK